MMRFVRNASFVAFLLVGLYVSQPAAVADACEDFFYSSCHVTMYWGYYEYECTTSYECDPFIHNCCQQYCGTYYDSECWEAGYYRWGSCQCL
jgi:hypothetical protein